MSRQNKHLLPPFTVWNQHNFCFRVKVPNDLRDKIQRQEIRLSLKTDVPWEAARKSAALAQYMRRRFFELRKDETGMEKLHLDELQGLIYTDDGKLVGLVGEEMKELTKKDIFDYIGRYDRRQLESTIKAPVDAILKAPEKTFPTLSQAITDYIDFHVSRGEWTPKTEKQGRVYLGMFQEYIVEAHGDIPVDQITKTMTNEFRKCIKKLPPHRNSTSKFKGMSITKLAKMKHDEVLTDNTTFNIMVRVSALFGWLIDMDLADKNPIGKIIKGVKPESDKPREAFDSSDLDKIFHAAEYMEDKLTSYNFWMPILGLFSGARVNELSQLHCSDVIENDGTVCISINDDHPDQHLKTKASRRVIPLHPFLLRVGFPEYVRDMAAQGHERIFPELVYDRVNGYGYRVSDDFRVLRNRLGISRTKTFHSFRRSFIDAMNNAQVFGNTISDFVGHSKAGKDMAAITAHYLSKATTEALKAAISKVRYNVDFKHLLKSRFAR